MPDWGKRMALQIKKGDLFDHLSNPCLIAHGCNAQGKMNSGFAKQIRLRFPLAYMAYREDWANGDTVLGSVGFVRCEDSITIANCTTQVYYGRTPGVKYASLDAVVTCLNTVVNYVKKLPSPILLPLIGGGLGGLDSDELISKFKEIFDDVDATLWLKEKHDVPNSYAQRARNRLRSGPEA